VALGIQATFAYPSSSYGATVGVMRVYQREAGDDHESEKDGG
jgi:hypothetical protein